MNEQDATRGMLVDPKWIKSRVPGLTNSAYFSEIRRIQAGPNLKNHQKYCLLFLKKIKKKLKSAKNI
jgi:hypothetical protein